MIRLIAMCSGAREPPLSADLVDSIADALGRIDPYARPQFGRSGRCQLGGSVDLTETSLVLTGMTREEPLARQTQLGPCGG
jgi:hypothetical protein